MFRKSDHILKTNINKKALHNFRALTEVFLCMCVTLDKIVSAC